MNPSSESSIFAPKLSRETLDLFWVKHSILKAITNALPEFSGILLDVGCGSQPYRSLLTSSPSKVDRYLGLDLQGQSYGGVPATERTDLTWDGITIPLANDSIDTAIATEVLEHCPEPAVTLSEIYRVLRPGGTFFFTVPFLWPLHDSPCDFWRYTPYSLESLLKNAGFRSIQLTSLGGWDASLGQMLSLWLTRRPCATESGRKLRGILSRLCLPLIRKLYLRDHLTEEFSSNPMVTGISGIVRK